MKKFIFFASILIAMCLLLGACSTDFSGVIEEKTSQLYDTIRSFAEPFLKEDPSYNQESDELTEENQTSSEEQTNEN